MERKVIYFDDDDDDDDMFVNCNWVETQWQ
jgi:hypothetical protein